MVDQGQVQIEETFRGQRPMPVPMPGPTPMMPGPSVRAAPVAGVNQVLAWMAGLSWSWFGTWILSGVIATLAGVGAGRRLSTRPGARGEAVVFKERTERFSPEPHPV